LRGKSLLDRSQQAERILFAGSYHSRGFDKQNFTIVKPSWIERYAIRADGRSLIHNLSGWPDDAPIPAGGRWEYFDLNSDPKEKVSLPLDGAGQKLRRQLLEFEKTAKQQVKQHNVSDQGLQKNLEDMKNLGYLGK
jgi:hypothetical protein